MNALVSVNYVVADEADRPLEDLVLRLVCNVALRGRQVPICEERVIHALVRAVLSGHSVCRRGLIVWTQQALGGARLFRHFALFLRL